MPKAVPAELCRFFEDNPRPALAFSGGADSSYLFYAAVACGADVDAFFVKTRFQPAFELRDAQRTAEFLQHGFTIIREEILADTEIRSNGYDRCYHCKKKLFGWIKERAEKNDNDLVIDATNASDNPAERPGMRALREMGIVSPLRLCGITKSEVRKLSKEAGLWTWDLPSNSCLATRVQTGTELTEAVLADVESSEDDLRALGLVDFRTRVTTDGSRLETTEEQAAFLEKNKEGVTEILLKYYPSVSYGIRKPGE